MSHRDAQPAPAGDEHTSAAVLEAYCTAETLHRMGWRFQCLTYDQDTSDATITAQTHTRRVVTIGWNRLSGRKFRQQVPGMEAVLALKLAYDVAHVGGEGQDNGQALMDELCWMMQALPSQRRRGGGRRWLRFDALPTLPADEQPRRLCRAAAWLLARLVAKYGWQVTALGSEIADSGFIAEIPGDVLAVFPGGMPADGTAAASLAALLPRLTTGDVALLERLNYHDLWAADHRASSTPR